MINVNMYRENRAKFSLEELKPYDGQWVAFSADGSRVVASAASLDELEERLEAAGEKAGCLGFERIVLDDDSFLGGAELSQEMEFPYQVEPLKPPQRARDRLLDQLVRIIRLNAQQDIRYFSKELFEIEQKAVMRAAVR